jgi:peptidoglycan/LPS O-acetylase OafA/YrhL
VSLLYEWPIAFGAAILIVFAPTAAWLKSPRLLELGRISYSLYLSHLPVLLTVFHLGAGILPFWALSILSVLLSLIVAWVMYNCVEAPSIRLAKWFGKPTEPTIITR